MRRSSLRAGICLTAIIAGVGVFAGSAQASLPSSATEIPVVGGTETPNIDAHLHPAASITGTIKSASGPLSARVSVFLAGKLIGSTDTADQFGHYLLGGLAASATGYTVCVSGASVNNTGPTGYLGRCWKTAPFNGSKPSSSATKVPLTAGQHRGNINITLPPAAAISGRVVNTSGTGLENTTVYAKNRSTGATFLAYSQLHGAFKIIGLTASHLGYSVCVDPGAVAAGSGNLGYLLRCFGNVPWTYGHFPSAATPVSVSLGQVHRGVKIALPTAAAITGKLTDAVTTNPVSSGSVELFYNGTFVTSTSPDGTGRYRFVGVRASTSNQVCVHSVGTGVPGVIYEGQCWKNVPFDNVAPPAGATKIRTRAGHVHGGINFALTTGSTPLHGAITGTITESAGGHPLQNAAVVLFDSAGHATNAFTDATGSYQFLDQPARDNGYRICAKAITPTSSPSIPVNPTGGWAPRCFDNVGWNGTSVPSSLATTLSVDPGQTVANVDIALRAGGAISGHTFESGTGTPLSFVDVYVYTPSGRFLAHATSASVDGAYSFTNLAPSATGYDVCFDGSDLVPGEANWVPQCWQDKNWVGIP